MGLMGSDSRVMAQLALWRPFCLSRSSRARPKSSRQQRQRRGNFNRLRRSEPMTQDTNLDTTKLESLLGTMVNEMGAAANAALVLIGDKLGLFRALAGAQLTSAELAKKTGTHERYVREWLASQAA